MKTLYEALKKAMVDKLESHKPKKGFCVENYLVHAQDEMFLWLKIYYRDNIISSPFQKVVLYAIPKEEIHAIVDEYKRKHRNSRLDIYMIPDKYVTEKDFYTDYNLKKITIFNLENITDELM